jgi:hypothetical protein
MNRTDKIRESLIAGKASGWRCGDKPASSIRNVETAVATKGTTRKCFQQGRLNLSRGGVLFQASRKLLTRGRCVQRKLVLGVEKFLPAVIENLDNRADGHGRQESYDQNRNGPPEQRFSFSQAQVGGTAEAAG